MVADCVACTRRPGRFWACGLSALAVHPPPQKPKTRGTLHHTHPTSSQQTRHPANRIRPAQHQSESRPQNRPLVILIPPAHTTPAILPLGDGSLCHLRGWASGISVRQLFGGGVGWRLPDLSVLSVGLPVCHLCLLTGRPVMMS